MLRGGEGEEEQIVGEQEGSLTIKICDYLMDTKAVGKGKNECKAYKDFEEEFS